MPLIASLPEPWASVKHQLRQRGLRWTPQRGVIVRELAGTKGHLTGAELIERCRRHDAEIVPSTVYRTLDVLEQLGLVRHGHGADGREEFHVGASTEHGHRYCASCGRHWEIEEAEAAAIGGIFSASGFELDASHVTVVGRCRDCRDAESAVTQLSRSNRGS